MHFSRVVSATFSPLLFVPPSPSPPFSFAINRKRQEISSCASGLFFFTLPFFFLD